MNTLTENKVIAETLKRNEEIFGNFVKELQEGLQEKKLNINGVEQLMLKTVEKLKSNVVTATNEIASEESKKKLLLEVAKHAEKIRLSQPKKVT